VLPIYIRPKLYRRSCYAALSLQIFYPGTYLTALVDLYVANTPAFWLIRFYTYGDGAAKAIHDQAVIRSFLYLPHIRFARWWTLLRRYGHS